MDVYLIVITIILAIILLVSNFYFVIYFLDENEKGFADSWFPKILVVSFI